MLQTLYSVVKTSGEERLRAVKEYRGRFLSLYDSEMRHTMILLKLENGFQIASSPPSYGINMVYLDMALSVCLDEGIVTSGNQAVVAIGLPGHTHHPRSRA